MYTQIMLIVTMVTALIFSFLEYKNNPKLLNVLIHFIVFLVVFYFLYTCLFWGIVVIFLLMLMV